MARCSPAVGIDDQPITLRSRIGLAAALLIGRCGNARGFERKPEVGNDDIAQRTWHRVSSHRRRQAGRPATRGIAPDVSLGAFGVFLVLFAETGLLIGFFLPGDSLLFTAGLLCTTTATGSVHLNVGAVLPAAAAGALLGAQAGFYLGKRGGRPLLARSSNKHLQRGVDRAEEILDQYGHGKAIVLARFIPVVRTVLNPLAGILEVPTRTFVLWQSVRRPGLVDRRHARRVRARLQRPEHRQIPAADHRGDRHRLADPARARTAPLPQHQQLT